MGFQVWSFVPWSSSSPPFRPCHRESLLPRNCLCKQSVCVDLIMPKEDPGHHGHHCRCGQLFWGSGSLQSRAEIRCLSATKLWEWIHWKYLLLSSPEQGSKADKLHCNCALSCRVHLRKVIYIYSTADYIVAIYIYIQFAALCRGPSFS